MNAPPSPLRWHLRWLTAGWVFLVLVVLLSLTPRVPSLSGLRHFDKLEHCWAYLLLMAWFGGLSERSLHRWIALALVALGAVVELAQGAGGYRHADVWDLVADGVGVLAGLWLARRWAPAWFGAAERALAR